MGIGLKARVCDVLARRRARVGDAQADDGLNSIGPYESMSLEELLRLKRNSTTYGNSKGLNKAIAERVESGVPSNSIPKHPNTRDARVATIMDARRARRAKDASKEPKVCMHVWKKVAGVKEYVPGGGYKCAKCGVLMPKAGEPK